MTRFSRFSDQYQILLCILQSTPWMYRLNHLLCSFIQETQTSPWYIHAWWRSYADGSSLHYRWYTKALAEPSSYWEGPGVWRKQGAGDTALNSCSMCLSNVHVHGKYVVGVPPGRYHVQHLTRLRCCRGFKCISHAINAAEIVATIDVSRNSDNTNQLEGLT